MRKSKIEDYYGFFGVSKKSWNIKLLLRFLRKMKIAFKDNSEFTPEYVINAFITIKNKEYKKSYNVLHSKYILLNSFSLTQDQEDLLFVKLLEPKEKARVVSHEITTKKQPYKYLLTLIGLSVLTYEVKGLYKFGGGIILIILGIACFRHSDLTNLIGGSITIFVGIAVLIWNINVSVKNVLEY
ncbi:MAG: hypothetical protein H6582_00490 [Crocinitomicaceae bacterium]|nr:hypothetical protein [Crocinitomicaceae bacterium]